MAEILKEHYMLDISGLTRARVQQKCTGCGRAIQPRELYLKYKQNGNQTKCLMCVTRQQMAEHLRRAAELDRWLKEQVAARRTGG